MNYYKIDELVDQEIRAKIPNCSKFIGVQSCFGFVKLDGTFSMDELALIMAVFKKYEAEMGKP